MEKLGGKWRRDEKKQKGEKKTKRQDEDVDGCGWRGSGKVDDGVSFFQKKEKHSFVIYKKDSFIKISFNFVPS